MEIIILLILILLVIGVLIICFEDNKEYYENIGKKYRIPLRYSYWRNPRYRYNFRFPHKYNRYCTECETRSPYNCKNCINCGLCYNENGYVQCIPGDINGPYFREDCTYWQYK